MIKSFKHKGLELYYLTDNAKGIIQEHKTKIRRILTQLNSAEDIQDMNSPDFSLHNLKGDRQKIWSITVRANWRITFKFERGNAYILDYEDYH
jgi:toxin HigB-1